MTCFVEGFGVVADPRSVIHPVVGVTQGKLLIPLSLGFLSYKMGIKLPSLIGLL